VPALPLQDRVEVPVRLVLLRVIEVRVRLHDRPVVGEIVNDRLTVPVKPWTAAIVIVEGPVAPLLIVTTVGFAVRVKSVTVSWNVPELPEWAESPR
jgi:hypothetical protein